MSIPAYQPSQAAVRISLSDKLKVATNVQHRQLESLPISQTIVSPEITVSQYANYLQLMHPAVLQVENAIHPRIAEIVTDISERQKAGAIANDLLFLQTPLNDSPGPFGNTATYSNAFCLGILYCVEGSVLGGRYILANLQKTADYDKIKGATSYFEGYGNRTGSMWKHFIASLNNYAATEELEQEIIQGAQFAFTSLSAHFMHYLPVNEN